MKRRTYTLGSRAEGMEEKRQAVLDAAFELFAERDYQDITLQEIAQRAHVSLPTVTRGFRKKAEIFRALWEREDKRVTLRRTVPVANAAAAAKALVADYEIIGRATLRFLAAEQRFPELKKLLAQGRAAHRSWIGLAFAPWLRALSPSTRKRRIAQLTLVCDVYAWKLWRIDFGLSQRETATLMQQAIEALASHRGIS